MRSMSSGSRWLSVSLPCSRRASTHGFNGARGARPPTSVFPGPTRRRFACWLIVLLALLDPAAAGGHLSRFEVTRDADGYRVDASADLDADQAVVWETLTDYEKLPQFVPGIHRVRVLAMYEQAGRQRLLIEQAGELRFLFFARRVVVLLDVEQQPRTRVDARAVPLTRDPEAGEESLNQFEGTYTLMPIPGGVRFGYRAHFTPDFALPPILGSLAVRRTMQAQFEAMLAEIDRRRLVLAPQGQAR
jgi:Polyketide cyclase / dehydrase and lipid transport